MSLLIVDGKRFTPYATDDESKFEEYVKQYYKEIFGEKSLLFEKKKLTSLAGISSIPDGFVIDFSSRKWYIVEIEIKKHDPHTHIAQQISKFMTAVYQPNKKSITDSFYRFIKDDQYRDLAVKNWIDSTEIFKFLNEVVEREPSIIVIIDERTRAVVEACETLKFPTIVQEFKIFQREGVGVNVHAVQFEPIITQKVEKPEAKGGVEPSEDNQPWAKEELLPYLKGCTPYQRVLLAVLVQSPEEQITREELISRMNDAKRKSKESIKKEITGFDIAGARAGLKKRRKHLGKEDIILEKWDATIRHHVYGIKQQYKAIVSEWAKEEHLLN